VRIVEKRGSTLEEALEAALVELGVSEQEATVEVLEEGGAGREAVVRVQAAGDQDADPDDLEEQADAAADFVEELLAAMGIEAIAEPTPSGGHMYVDIVDGPPEDFSLLIGRHGQTLDAIQELMRTVVGRRLDERILVIVDCEDYRKRRAERLEERAKELAQRAIESGREQELEPMTPLERKIVHDAVAGVVGAESSSRGDEPNRFVVIRRR
jgi:spoIIIJ-associated protein